MTFIQDTSIPGKFDTGAREMRKDILITNSPAPSYYEFSSLGDYLEGMEAFQGHWIGKYLDMPAEDLRQLIRERLQEELGITVDWEVTNTEPLVTKWNERRLLPGLVVRIAADGSCCYLFGSMALFKAAGLNSFKLQYIPDFQAAIEKERRVEDSPLDGLI